MLARLLATMLILAGLLGMTVAVSTPSARAAGANVARTV